MAVEQRGRASDVPANNQTDTLGCDLPRASRHRAYDAVRHRCDRLHALVDSVFDASYEWDIESGHIEFSSQLAAFLGLEAGCLDNFAAWSERLHPEDRERVVAGLTRAAHEGSRYKDEYRMRRADGTYVLVRDRGVTIADEAGRPYRMVGAMRDVTQEREAQRVLEESVELYQTLFDKGMNPAFLVDQMARYIDANRAGLEFLGVSRDQLLGTSMARQWGAEAEKTVRAVTSGAVTLTAEVRARGLNKAVVASIVPCHRGGQLMSFVLATDVTEYRTLQQALEESNIALRVILQQRNRDREDFEKTIVSNLEQMVLPLLTRIAPHIARSPEAAVLDTAVNNLREIMQPLAQSIRGTDGESLTLREREIATLIRAGKTSAEIAEALYISPGTVAFHRKNIRRKLGLEPRGPRLTSHLAAAPAQRGDAGAR